MNIMGLSVQHLLRYVQMEKIRITGLLLGSNHGCVTTNPKQGTLQCNGSIPVDLQPKRCKVYEYAMSLEGYAYRVLGFSGSSPFSEAW
jgi:hypothetical protein